MTNEKQDETGKTPLPREEVTLKTASEQEADCRCKEAQGKTITDFLKVMIDDLAFWRKKH